MVSDIYANRFEYVVGSVPRLGAESFCPDLNIFDFIYLSFEVDGLSASEAVGDLGSKWPYWCTHPSV